MSNPLSLLRFNAGTGHIWLDEQRMLLLHARALAALRKELVDSLGVERTRGLLMRMGFAHDERYLAYFKPQAIGQQLIDFNIGLLGETGVGKEMFARWLHDHGPRSKGPFIAVYCAAIPHELIEAELFGVEKGAYTGAQLPRAERFERAHGGSLFLDEVGDLSLAIEKYGALYGKKLRGLTDKAMREVLSHPWPGNIRVLENAIERAVLLAPDGGSIEAPHLFGDAPMRGGEGGGVDAKGHVTELHPDSLDQLCEQALAHHIDLESIERRLMQLAMQRAQGNLSHAARLLGITRPQLAYRLKKEGLPAG